MAVTNKRCFMLFVLFMWVSLKVHLSYSVDRISTNQSLSGNQTIVSAGGAFELGFFKPGNSSNFYIGIWYKKVSKQNVVWVANRESPVSDKHTSELRISDGNLVLLSDSKIPIWSTNLISTSSSFVVAILLDEGNLVLRDGSNSSEPLWQSFDQLTDTWLPGCKFGFNKVSEKITTLTSWKNREDPSPGLFSSTLDPNQTQFISLWNMTKQFWNSGSWNGRSFSLVPVPMSENSFSIRYVSNTNESYFIYSPFDNSVIFQFVMDVGGQVQQRLWSQDAQQWRVNWSKPIFPCSVYGYCGAFGSCRPNSDAPRCHCVRGFYPKLVREYNSGVYSAGCIRRINLDCSQNSDRFFAGYNMVLPENEEIVDVKSVEDCKSACLNNCSCTSYAYDSAQCQIWNGDLWNLQQLEDGSPSGKTLYIKLAASEFEKKPKSKYNKGIATAVLVLCSVVVLLALVLMVLRKIFIQSCIKRPLTVVEGSLTAFRYRDLEKATRNFSEKLGAGGFGSVFKGKLPDLSLIAVKKIESITQGEKQFRAEVRTIGTIQHVNLVRLRGFCSKGTKKLLVYDYMENGSLSSHLFRQNNTKLLDWKTRYEIVLGTARGLAYLHEKCRDCIIHCDIKPDNILLDGDFCAKVSDFGLAKLFGRDFSRVLTTIRGTIGYLAPEWISGVPITAKADVYSFGMMLFEIISGRRNSEHCNSDGNTRYFPICVASLINEEGDVLSLLDSRLEGEADVEELTRVCKVACWCIQDEIERPSMGQVVHILDGVLDIGLPPIPRVLAVLEDHCGDQFSSES